MELKGLILTLIDIKEAIVSDNGFLDKIEVEKNAIYIIKEKHKLQKGLFTKSRQNNRFDI
jgi:hypothetical protein